MSMEKQGIVNEDNTPPEGQPRDAAAVEKQGLARPGEDQQLDEHLGKRLADQAAKNSGLPRKPR